MWMTVIPKRRGRPPSGGREEILRATLDVLRERGMAKLIGSRKGIQPRPAFVDTLMAMLTPPG
jgi:hypothetical protein